MFFLPEPVAFSAGLRYLRLTRLPRHDRGPVPGGNRSAASCLCTVLRRALYHYATRSPCRVRSLEGRRGGTSKQTTHQETKTKLSSATPNRDKTIHCLHKHRKKHPASNVAAESAPHPRHVAKAYDNFFFPLVWPITL